MAPSFPGTQILRFSQIGLELQKLSSAKNFLFAKTG